MDPGGTHSRAPRRLAPRAHGGVKAVLSPRRFRARLALPRRGDTSPTPPRRASMPSSTQAHGSDRVPAGSSSFMPSTPPRTNTAHSTRSTGSATSARPVKRPSSTTSPTPCPLSQRHNREHQQLAASGQAHCPRFRDPINCRARGIAATSPQPISQQSIIAYSHEGSRFVATYEASRSTRGSQSDRARPALRHARIRYVSSVAHWPGMVNLDRLDLLVGWSLAPIRKTGAAYLGSFKRRLEPTNAQSVYPQNKCTRSAVEYRVPWV